MKPGSLNIRIRVPRSVWQASAAVVILAVLVFLAWRLPLAWRIHRHLANIRAAGLPTSGKELNAWYQKPFPGQNAALVLTRALTLQRGFDDWRSNWLANPRLDYRAQWPAGTR